MDDASPNQRKQWQWKTFCTLEVTRYFEMLIYCINIRIFLLQFQVTHVRLECAHWSERLVVCVEPWLSRYVQMFRCYQKQSSKMTLGEFLAFTADHIISSQFSLSLQFARVQRPKIQTRRKRSAAQSVISTPLSNWRMFLFEVPCTRRNEFSHLPCA